jgi:hypothetical protein
MIIECQAGRLNWAFFESRALTFGLGRVALNFHNEIDVMLARFVRVAVLLRAVARSVHTQES